MRLLAAVRVAHDPVDPATWPSVSVVVASRDPEPAVLARIEDLLATDYPAGSLDVVVSLDAMSDAVRTAFGHPDPRVRIVAGDAPGGKAAALNAGVRAASGEVVVFTDTHQRLERDALRRLVRRLLGDDRIGAVSGRLELPEGSGLVARYWRVERRLRRDEAAVHSAVGVSGSIYAMRRALWTPLPAGLILDDLYVPMRLVLAGHRIGFADDARARDSRRTEPAEEYRRKVRTLTGNFQLCAWLPDVLVPVRNPIWLQFVCHKLLRLLTPWILLVGGVSAMLAAAARYGPALVLLPLLAVLLAGVAAAALGQWARLRAAVEWGMAMQAAIVTATRNGVLGRWDVWRR